MTESVAAEVLEKTLLLHTSAAAVPYNPSSRRNSTVVLSNQLLYTPTLTRSDVGSKKITGLIS